MKTKKILLMALAALLLVAVSVGGTVAYLTATSGPVTNTFEPAGIDIELKETVQPDGTVVEAGVTNWTAALIPGEKYAKNPTVTLVKADCDVYIFVTIEDSATGVEYEVIAENWTLVPGETNVWYREATANDEGESWQIIDGVTIDPDLDATDMPGSNTTLVFNAYAVQKLKSDGVNFTAAEAWAQVNP